MSIFASLVGIAWALAILLFLIAVQLRRGSRTAALAGVLILIAAALYVADIVNMPEVLGAMLIGLASGFLIGRDLPARMGGRLLALAAGGVGAAAGAMAVAMWLNPYALGMIAEGMDDMMAGERMLLRGTLVLGALAGVAGIAAFKERESGVMTLGAISLAGWAVAGSAFLLDHAGMMAAGGVAGSAACTLALRSRAETKRKGLADPSPHP